MSEVVRGSITREEYLLRYYSRARVRVRVRRFASLESLETDCAEKCPRIPCSPNASADDPPCVRAHTHTLACVHENKKHKEIQRHSHAFESGIRHHPELLQTEEFVFQTEEDRPLSPSRRSHGSDSLHETLHSNCTLEAEDRAQDLSGRARAARETAGVMRRILKKARDVLAPDRNSVHPSSSSNPEPADLGAVDDTDAEIHDQDEVSDLIGIEQFADAALAVQTAGVDNESPSIASSIHELGAVSNVIRMGQFADAARAVQTAEVFDESEGAPSIASSSVSVSNLLCTGCSLLK
jgi:hypothetical protein